MTAQPFNPSYSISQNTVVVASSDQVSSDLAGESVILNLKTSTYYGLNAVGSSVWLLIQEPKTFHDVCEAILQEYDVDPQTCENDVQTLLADLLSVQLVEIRG